MRRVTAFRWVPPFAQGLVRDLRVRWALEEAGLSYEERLIGANDQKSDAYLVQQPFGQVPVYEEDDLVLFESGAIVLHIAEQSDRLMPGARDARARVRSWIFAAINSIEPQVSQLGAIDFFFKDEAWAKERRPGILELVDKRLDGLERALGDREWLEGDFSAADLMMTTVLRILRETDVLARRPTLAEYKKRGEARPAFAKALADQMAPFAKYAPPNA